MPLIKTIIKQIYKKYFTHRALNALYSVALCLYTLKIATCINVVLSTRSQIAYSDSLRGVAQRGRMVKVFGACSATLRNKEATNIVYYGFDYVRVTKIGALDFSIDITNQRYIQQ